MLLTPTAPAANAGSYRALAAYQQAPLLHQLGPLGGHALTHQAEHAGDQAAQAARFGQPEHGAAPNQAAEQVAQFAPAVEQCAGAEHRRADAVPQRMQQVQPPDRTARLPQPHQSVQQTCF